MSPNLHVMLVDVKCISGMASERNFGDPNEDDQYTPCILHI